MLIALLLVAAVGSWSKAPQLPHPRSAHAVVVERNSIYVLGGPSTAVVDRFDGKRWRRETTLPGGKLNAPAAVAINGKIYVIGGFSGSTNAPVARVRVYDTATRRWSSAAPLPASRGGHAAVVLDGKIHVIGGGNSESTIADHSVYDPASNSWSKAPPLPRPEGSPAAVVFQGKLYAIGAAGRPATATALTGAASSIASRSEVCNGARVRVVVTHPVPPPAVELLEERGYDVVIGPSEDPYEPAALAGLVAGTDGVLALLIDRLDAAVMDAAGPQLKVVSNFAVGHDNIDLAEAARRGIKVGNTPDVLTQAVAEHTMALILAVARRIVEGDRIVRERHFRRWGPSFLLGMELRGKTLLIVGSGRIGNAVARIAGDGFGMKVETVGRDGDLHGALGRADVVTLHVPLTPETHHLIGSAELEAMKPEAVLVNTARGPVVDEAALVQALRAEKIAGAGLDVYEHEPDLAPGLAELENVVLEPHTASATREARTAMSRLAAENVIAALEGRPLLSEVGV